MGIPRISSLAVGTFVVLGLSLTPNVLAHGDESSGHGNGHDGGNVTMEEKEYPPTYFSHPEHAGVMYAHVILMVVSWVFILPIAVMFSLVSSRYKLAAQFAFLAVNAVGVLLAVVYNAQTPDLYPGNAHHSIGWIVTWVVSAHILVSLVGRVAGVLGRFNQRDADTEHQFIPVSTTNNNGRHSVHFAQGYRLSDDSGQGTEPTTESLRSSSNSVSSQDDDEDSLSISRHAKEYNDQEQDLEAMPFASHTTKGALAHALSRLVSWRIWTYIEMGYKIIDRIILPFGFIAFTTGIATYGRFFEGHAIFGGLAHWIKGGVFFWLGLFTLGRWTGSFADFGWAWNAWPRYAHQKWRFSAEFVESALIFVYGSTNIFLEHLGGSGGKWTAQDLEHVSITVLFIGGGLCGMLIESTRVRELLNTTISEAELTDTYFDIEREYLKPPQTYEFSMNPIPALVILLLGIMMSSHQQHSMTSSMVHKQWGDLLLAASFARVLTYILVFIRPPRSVFPSRPPTELLASFGLIAGGIIFMASSSDTVEGMIHYELDAMFLYTVTMGMVGLLMAWVVVVLAIKGWALRLERRASGRRFA